MTAQITRGSTMSAVAAQHALSRYAERYDAAMTMAELRAIEHHLSSGAGMLLRRNPDGDEVRAIQHAGRFVIVVYSVSTATVKTFLPADAATLSGRRRNWRKNDHP